MIPDQVAVIVDRRSRLEQMLMMLGERIALVRQNVRILEGVVSDFDVTLRLTHEQELRQNAQKEPLDPIGHGVGRGRAKVHIQYDDSHQD